MRKAICVLTGDWHLMLKPPVCRAGEKDWLQTQARYLNQVRRVAERRERLKATPAPLPIILTGDVFHKPNPTPELINWAIDHVPPNVHAVPGNHDLPNQRLQDVDKSGYWTLVKAGVINNLDPEASVPLPGSSNVSLVAFPWGREPEPTQRHDLSVQIAVVHKYLWVKGCGYRDAPNEARIGRVASRFDGFDVVVSGDNHIPFVTRKNGTLFVNTGSLMRIAADQEGYVPCVWVLYDDLSVEPRKIDVSADAFDRSHRVGREGNPPSRDFADLSQAMKEVRDEQVGFDEAVRRVCRRGGLRKDVREMLIEILGSE